MRDDGGERREVMKLTAKNYFSNEANQYYMSVSQFKEFERCEAAALAKVYGNYAEEPTTAMLVGSYVDAYYEGTVEAFREEHPEIFKRDGSLKADFAVAEAVIARTKRDAMFQHYMGGAKQVIMTGIIDGVPVKCKIDSMMMHETVDLKVMRSFDDVYVPDFGRVPWFMAWGYDMQGSVYQEIRSQNEKGVKKPFILAAATKEAEPDIDLIEIVQEDLDNALLRFRQNVVRYDAIKKGAITPDRCGKCAWCRRTKALDSVTKSTEYGW